MGIRRLLFAWVLSPARAPHRLTRLSVSTPVAFDPDPWPRCGTRLASSVACAVPPPGGDETSGSGALRQTEWERRPCQESARRVLHTTYAERSEAKTTPPLPSSC